MQTTYTDKMAPALPGMAADASFLADTIVCEGAINFGVAVGRGTEAKQGVQGATAFRGVSIRDVTSMEGDVLADQTNAAVMYQGDVWVTVGGAVTAGGAVTYAQTTGVLSSAAAGAAQFAVERAEWMTSAASGGLALLRLKG